ncbi:GNAT family N-acetyltransferase [Streptomyces afghaniensis]|uniref:GNAT family N-acetyltransferase n=1 Tax=Streptomyces afghaniensis TaxID=66865 RepID=UPI0033A9317E
MVCRMFRLETEVDKARRDLLRTRLRETNTAASPVLRALRGTPDERDVPLHVWAVNDTNDALAGGLVGYTWASWLHVTYLWVDERLRGRGMGARLLSEAERIASRRGCHAARLETWDFQAPRFYEKQGYEVACVVPDYPPGITEYTLTKRLG